MLIIVFVNLDRRHGDAWEGHVSSSVDDASMRFEDPGREDLASAQGFSLSSHLVLNQEGLETGSRLDSQKERGSCVKGSIPDDHV